MNDEEIKQITDYIDAECYIVNSIIKTYEKCGNFLSFITIQK